MFTIPKAKRKSQINTIINPDIPGPGNYRVNNNFTSAYQPSFACKFSQQKRGQKTISPCGPGVGKYNPNIIVRNSPQYHIAQKQHQKEILQNCYPGPGSYVPILNAQKTPAFTIPKAQNKSLSLSSNSSLSVKNLPGPGAYNGQNSSLQKKSARFGSAKRADIIRYNDIPGVGSYNQISDYLQKFPSYSFGKQSKKFCGEEVIREAQKIPGPGEYHVNGSYLSQSGGVIQGKYNNGLFKNIIKSSTPGPGQYEQVIQSLKKSINTSFSRSPRKSISSSPSNSARNELNPAPNQYNIRNLDIYKPKNPSYNFTQAKRHQKSLDNQNNFPGPNQYTIPFTRNGPKYSISHRGKPIHEISIQDMPSPNQYNPNWKNIRKKSPQPIISQAEKRSYFNEFQYQSISPGPGAYRIPKINLKKVDQSYSFSKSKKGIYKQQMTSPGPGYYNVPNNLQDIPKYLLPLKLKINY